MALRVKLLVGAFGSAALAVSGYLWLSSPASQHPSTGRTSDSSARLTPTRPKSEVVGNKIVGSRRGKTAKSFRTT